MQKVKKITQKILTCLAINLNQIHTKRTRSHWQIQADLSRTDKSQIIKLKISKTLL